MHRQDLFNELSFLTAIDAPSGFEEPVLRFVRDGIKQYVDSVEIDVRGNLFARKLGTSENAPCIMIVAHADEVGFMVTHVTPAGFLRFTKLGGPTDMVLPGRHVRVLADSGPLEGIIGVKPGHILSGDDARRLPPVEEMYIDIGASSESEAALWGVEVGTPAVFVGELIPIRDTSLVFGKAVDDRAGVLAMIKTAEKLHGQKLPADIVWCLSVEEETGLRGAAAAALDILPDVIIALDTCPAGGTPELADDSLPWRIGKGPLIKVRETRGLSTHRPLRELFRSTAEEHGIPYQLVVDTAGITDATSAQQASGKIAALSLGLARRYSHSAVELLDIEDAAGLIDLLTAALPLIEDRRQLMRI